MSNENFATLGAAFASAVKTGQTAQEKALAFVQRLAWALDDRPLLVPVAWKATTTKGASAANAVQRLNEELGLVAYYLGDAASAPAEWDSKRANNMRTGLYRWTRAALAYGAAIAERQDQEETETGFRVPLPIARFQPKKGTMATLEQTWLKSGNGLSVNKLLAATLEERAGEVWITFPEKRGTKGKAETVSLTTPSAVIAALGTVVKTATGADTLMLAKGDLIALFDAVYAARVALGSPAYNRLLEDAEIRHGGVTGSDGDDAADADAAAA